MDYVRHILFHDCQLGSFHKPVEFFELEEQHLALVLIRVIFKQKLLLNRNYMIFKYLLANPAAVL